MKLLIKNVKCLLDDKLSLHMRGLLITIMLLREDDPKLTLAKLKAKVKMKAEEFPLLMLHKWGYIEWSEYNKVIKRRGNKGKWDKEVEEIITFFNNLTGKSLNHKAATQTTLLRARLNDNYTIDQIKSVIANRYEEWKDNSDMAKHLYPTTIFRPSKFPKYLEEVKRTKVGTGIVAVENLHMEHGQEITFELAQSFVDQDTYLIKTYRVNDEDQRVGSGFKGTRYGKAIKSSLKIQHNATQRGEQREFIYVYLKK